MVAFVSFHYSFVRSWWHNQSFSTNPLPPPSTLWDMSKIDDIMQMTVLPVFICMPFLYLDANVTEICFYGPNRWWGSIGWGNCLVPTRRHAITISKYDLVYLQICMRHHLPMGWTVMKHRLANNTKQFHLGTGENAKVSQKLRETSINTIWYFNIT